MICSASWRLLNGLIKANLNDESLVAYVDGLIQKLHQAQEENNRQSQDENERENDGLNRTRGRASNHNNSQ